jgi:hypothetical protein
MSNNKTEITKLIFAALPHINPFVDFTIDQLVFRWWSTGRVGAGLRLTEEGKNAFLLAEIEHYDYQLDLQKLDKKASRLPILIGKKISCPYYIGKLPNSKKILIRIYDSRVAMMINLYGNMNDYLMR